MSSKKAKKKHSTKNLGDVTINDFANSTVSKNRPKKSHTNVSVVLKKIEEEKDWFEKPLEDFDGDVVEVENEDGTISLEIKKPEGRRRKKTLSNSEDNMEKGKDYPIDIWYVLSEYIRPEDVGRFAAICKTAYEVVSSAKFWFGLYKRYYVKGFNLPPELQPECIVRKFGLRMSVIRALQYVYPPFIARTKKLSYEDHSNSLTRMQCMYVWHVKKPKMYRYYFKLQQKHMKTSNHVPKEKRSLLELLDDIYANQDEYCRVLRVDCQNYTVIPPVFGLTLTSVSLRLAENLKYRFHLRFGSGVNSCGPAVDGAGCINIILEPVSTVKVLDWWHPRYPRSHSMEHLLNQE